MDAPFFRLRVKGMSVWRVVREREREREKFARTWTWVMYVLVTV